MIQLRIADEVNRSEESAKHQREGERSSGSAVLLTSGVRVLEVWIEAFVHELDHLVHSAGLDIIHKFLQAGLHAEARVLLRTQFARQTLYKCDGLYNIIQQTTV